MLKKLNDLMQPHMHTHGHITAYHMACMKRQLVGPNLTNVDFELTKYLYKGKVT